MSLMSLFGKSTAAPDSYSAEVETAPHKDGEGRPRRYYGTVADPLVSMMPGVHNVHDNFLAGVATSGDKPFLGTRAVTNGVAGPYVWQTYNEVLKRVQNLASGLAKRGVKPNDNVCLFSINRAEWVIGEQAVLMLGAVTVPLYDTLGEEAIEFIVGQTSASIVMTTADKVKTLVGMAAKVKVIQTIILMDTPTDDLLKSATDAGFKVTTFVQLELEGSDAPQKPYPCTKDTIATICYTSGTTGTPKGVILTHENLLSFSTGARRLMELGVIPTVTASEVYLSYLPLAHVFERIVQCVVIYAGGSIGFYQGDTLKLLDDAIELKPTMFASVPRLYNRIYDKVLASAKSAGGIASALFNYAYAAKKENLRHGHNTHMLWDALVFSKVRARLGGRVRWMLTGAAPMSADVMDFLRICFSVEVTQGYGQTETSGGAACTVKQDLSSGHTGVPMPHSEIKLFDVPQLGYTSKDTPNPRGEICIRGTGVFKGYYKAPDKTAEVLDADGWCHTGDVGEWDSMGRLKIIDRVKHIFKLSQGEYIAPEKIEMVYQKHELVAQAFVYGDSLQSTVVAIVGTITTPPVPDADQFPKWAETHDIKGKSLQEICREEKIKKTLIKVLTDFGKANDLKGFEHVKNIHLEHEPFSADNGLLSPTFKLKRHEAKKAYERHIEAMYAEINSS
ncbi:medium-chain fatty acid-CoA ligase faa2 [Polyrhizophydium stewartii]|uniref:Long-chain-fatty-acid--CoA ligase n=1 Tax=Polyrhizophydium stewartii TaxID=2732419 RepID=A0ABR4NK86_9FUNG